MKVYFFDHEIIDLVKITSGVTKWLRCLLVELRVLGLNLTMPQKSATIHCLYDGSLDDKGAPKLIKRPECVLSCLCDWCT